MNHHCSLLVQPSGKAAKHRIGTLKVFCSASEGFIIIFYPGSSILPSENGIFLEAVRNKNKILIQMEFC